LVRVLTSGFEIKINETREGVIIVMEAKISDIFLIIFFNHILNLFFSLKKKLHTVNEQL